VNGSWQSGTALGWVIDPLNGDPIISYPDTTMNEAKPFIDSLKAVPKYGVHNPLLNPDRWGAAMRVCASMPNSLADLARTLQVPDVWRSFRPRGGAAERSAGKFRTCTCSSTLHLLRHTVHATRAQVLAFFARLIQRVSPKSLPQATAEVKVTQKFFENFGGDQVTVCAWLHVLIML
jgi:1-pyrroline-5-carboxylate dehydrogenase